MNGVGKAGLKPGHQMESSVNDNINVIYKQTYSCFKYLPVQFNWLYNRDSRLTLWVELEIVISALCSNVISLMSKKICNILKVYDKFQ